MLQNSCFFSKLTLDGPLLSTRHEMHLLLPAEPLHPPMGLCRPSTH